MDDDEFGVRERATQALLATGPRAVPWIIKHLRDAEMSLDARLRLERVCDALMPREWEGRNMSRGMARATEVLERVGTPEARQVLERVAKGIGPAAEQAQAAQRRLGN